MVKVDEEIKKAGIKALREDKCEIEKELVLKKKRCYKLKILEWVKRKNLVLGLTQENSMEFLV